VTRKDALYELEMARAELHEARNQNRDEEVVRHCQRNIEYWRRKIDNELSDETIDTPIPSRLR
jgi:hypothetical protein